MINNKQASLAEERNFLKHCGFNFSKMKDIDDIFKQKFEFLDSKKTKLIAGTVNKFYFTNSDNHQSVLEISLLMHQDLTLKCLRIFPGGILENGPKCFLISDPTGGDEKMPGFFKIVQDDSSFIECIYTEKFKKYFGFKGLSDLIDLPYRFVFKDGRILNKIKRVMITNIMDKTILEISLYLNQNSNYKCLRTFLDSEEPEWFLISSFDSGHKSYSGKFEFVK
jgi:hypothetical protein